jgi:hypothetical protein
MTLSVFRTQMQRVIDTFGKEYFPQPRMEEIFKVVKDLSDRDFTQVVTRIVGECSIKYPPTVLEFRTYAETKLKEINDKKNLDGLNLPKFPPQDFKTSDEVFDHVNMFMLMLVPEPERKDFPNKCRTMFPDLMAEIDILRERVKQGSIEARSIFMQKSKFVILKTRTSHLAFAKEIP